MLKTRGVGGRQRSRTEPATTSAWWDVRGWGYRPQSSRDLRLDLLRGAMVVAMVVDHVGGNSLFTVFTGRNEYIVSAAEGFIFISGGVLGIVYADRILRLGLAAALLAALRRARYLYRVTTGLTLAFLGLSLFTSYPLWVGREHGLGVGSPLEALVGALTLHYTYQGTDVLAIYVLLVATAPLALYLLASGRVALLLAGSFALWALYQFYPWMVDMPWSVRNSVFPYASWQFLFNAGLVLGYHRRRLGWLARALTRPVVMAPVALVIAGVIVFTQWQHGGRVNELGLPIGDAGFAWLYNKPSLGAGRIFAFAFYAALAFALVTRLWRPLRFLLGWLLLPLGQGALLAYGLHLLLLGPSQHWLAPALWGPGSTMLTATAAHVASLAPVFLVVVGQRALAALPKPWGFALSLLARRRVHDPIPPD